MVTEEYSVKGTPLLPGTMEIKYFIVVKEDLGVGDKGIFANQLKSTSGEIYDYDIVTEDGQDVMGLFSLKAILAREVESPMIMGTTSILLDKVLEKAIEIYNK